MKVVYLNPNGFLGGAEVCLLDLLAASGPGGWSPRVILGDDGPLRAEVEALGVACDVMPLPDRIAALGDSGLTRGGGGRVALAARGLGAVASATSYLARLGRRLRGEAADVVHTNGMKAHVLGAWAAPRGVPVVWHLHDDPSSRPVMARLLRRSARPGVRVVAVSGAVAARAGRVLGPRVPVETVYNAVDLNRFAPGPGDGAWLDAEAGLPPAPVGTVRLGLVATYARWKGHDVFLDAAARVAADLPAARFYVVGSPLYRSAGSQFTRDELRGRAEALGLTGRLGFVAHQRDPSSAYRALDVVVHASTRPEPFGRVIVEGMACGRAVVAMRAGGASELFEDGLTALGCPPNDPGALARAMARLASDPGLRRSLGGAGRASAEFRFDRARLAGEWAGVYAGRRT